MSTSLSDEQKIAVFRKMVDAWQDEQWRICADLLAPDGVLQSMMLEPVVGIMEFEGPHISVWREYHDRAQLLKAQNKTVDPHRN